jgi:spermidine/putrescine transport system ATP-binding protein
VTKLMLAAQTGETPIPAGLPVPQSACDPGKRTASAARNVASDGSSGEAAAPTVELRNVSHGYKGFHALSSIDLSIRPGEFFSLLGPSGCGKTTTLNIIGGFVMPDHGDVLINGKSVNRIPSYQRPVNTVFQNYALFPHMTVAQNVGFGPRMSRQTGPDLARRVEEALALVSLTGLGDRRPDQLSGGQQQRVALARALINRPTVLLLDEPLGALDLKLRKQMQLELSRIQREVGITFVYVTHDQEEALSMSDRIAVMSGGCVIQVGSPEEVYENPASLFVADFIGSSNKLKGRCLDIAGGIATVQLQNGASVRVPAGSAWGGREITIVVRPDHAAIATQAPGDAGRNALACRVAKVTYLGTHREIEVVLGDGGAASVRQSLGAEHVQLAPGVGEEAFLVWPVARSIGFSTQSSGGEQEDPDILPSSIRIDQTM